MGAGVCVIPVRGRPVLASVKPELLLKKQQCMLLIVRWSIVIRTHHVHENLNNSVFLLGIVGPDYYVRP